jgi:OOP family OmpA-OmpF porin
VTATDALRALRVLTVPLVGASFLLLAGCDATVVDAGSAPSASSRPSTSSAAHRPGASPGASPSASAGGVWGLAFGEIPAIPLIEVPDTSQLSAAQQDLAATIKKDLDALADIPGVEVAPARCDSGGQFVRDGAVLYGDGSGTFVDENGSIVNYGDGSGVASDGESSTVNYGDGAGTFSDGTTSIVNYGDGAGTYSSGPVSVVVYGDGAGSYSDATRSITNYGDGAGTYSSGGVSITNYGDGSGAFDDGTTSIVNYGDGTGLVNGVAVKLKPIAKMPAMGKFPPLAALKPLAPVCGLMLTLPDSVLFDFGSAELRPEAGTVISTVATAVGKAKLTGTVQVMGHTDSVSSDDFNQDLSERRARAVAGGLTAGGLSNGLDVKGFGEKQPVAPNEINGADNPAGRALNRRVEIVLPIS